MPLVTVQPAANESPDTGQGGLAVATPTNTGHASTSSSANGDDVGVTQTKTCRWSAFPAVAGQVAAVTLKVTHATNGALSGGTATNSFALEYSTNGGGAWNTAVSRTNYGTAEGPTTFSVGLSVGQDLTAVQVRDNITAAAVASGDSASATATISAIQIEVTLHDSGVVGFW